MIRKDKFGSLVFVALCISAIVVALLSSCLSIGRRPSWITSPPEDSRTMVYFISAGSNPDGDLAAAEAEASRSMVGEITKYIGVTISSNTTVEARATFDEYEARVTETINEQSQALIAGFRVVDRYVEKTKSGAAFVYLLGGYDSGELAKEKARFEALFAERIAAISAPEQEGSRLGVQGLHVQSALKLMEAAAAALTVDIDNAEIRFERTINAARDELSRVRLETLANDASSDIRTVVNTPFAEPFSIRVTNSAGVPLSGVPLLVTYRIARQDDRQGGRLTVRTASIATDEKGVARFDHPVPRLAGDREIIISLDLRDALEPLGSTKGKQADLVEALEDVLNGKRITIRYRIESLSASIPTVIYVAEVDINSVRVDSGSAARGVAGALTGAGFTITIAGTEPRLLSLRADELRDGIASDFAGSHDRILSGVATVLGVDESDGGFLVRVRGSVSVVDIATGREVYTANLQKTLRSRSREIDYPTVMSAIGEELGRILAAELP